MKYLYDFSETFTNQRLSSSTCFNLIGDGHKNLRDLILSSKNARAKIRVTLDDGREEVFSGTCHLSPSMTQSKTVIDVVEGVGGRSSGIDIGVAPDLESLKAAAAQQSRLLSTLNQAVAVSKSNASNATPFGMSAVSLAQPIFKSILPTFHLTEGTLNPPKSPPNAPDDISPQSSPEIIVDKLTPDGNDNRIAESDDSLAKEENAMNLTPTRASRGPKKNFLARQAALDATLNVLRMRAEKSKPSDGDSGQCNSQRKASNVSLEMSDNELIEGHLEHSSP